MDDIIDQYIPGKKYVIYSAYKSDKDGEPIDNLNEIAVKGKVILVGEADDFWGGKKAKDFRSKVLENPTWLIVAIHANATIKKTRDLHHVFLEGMDKKGKDGKATVYEFCMGS